MDSSSQTTPDPIQESGKEISPAKGQDPTPLEGGEQGAKEDSGGKKLQVVPRILPRLEAVEFIGGEYGIVQLEFNRLGQKRVEIFTSDNLCWILYKYYKDARIIDGKTGEVIDTKYSYFFSDEDKKPKEGWVVRLYNQDGENGADMGCLSHAESSALSEIIFKLLDNGFKLGIAYDTVQSVLDRLSASTKQSVCSSNLEANQIS